MTFCLLFGLIEPLQRTAGELDYTRPDPYSSCRAIPAVLKGRDLNGGGPQTGTGLNRLALPCLCSKRLTNQGFRACRGNALRALITGYPLRELAEKQLLQSFSKSYAQDLPLRTFCCYYGGCGDQSAD